MQELAGKRMLGWLNWNRGRRDVHRMDVLEQLLRDLHAQAPDHIALTGDVVNLALPGEYPAARAFLEKVGPPDRVSLVPGNHDAYTKGGALRLLSAFDPWMRGDNAGAHPLDEEERFPYVRLRGRVALIGLSSAIPTGPFMATGKLGPRQVSRLGPILEHLGHEGYCRVVMLHHPVRRQDAGPTAMLIDADRLSAVLRSTGAELILHGHIHSGLIHRVRGPKSMIPVVCTPSASAAPERARWPASYNLFTISQRQDEWRINLAVRGFVSAGHPPKELRTQELR
ncbi:3',5'-cyclic AMP phosphodiesterase CpdA [Labrys monachus]|uniref:3',5'-cyclic AMP phosphodiesterase CpdA n=2 Tax=Labrys monachus TaxID=217067 RepID=A0ABU0FJB9_9HYPH|nr:3',5'-cyclic AMP phosphodiesterase CpdA [Labrys monachus]